MQPVHPLQSFHHNITNQDHYLVPVRIHCYVLQEYQPTQLQD